ncbi:MAG: GNAT family N-acetyltransferase [Caldilineaceae bacterium]
MSAEAHMAPAHTISLVPLQIAQHAELLQAVYRAAPDYWALYGLDAAPANQALHDLREATETPGRTLMGIVRPVSVSSNGHEDERTRGAVEIVGMVDLRMHYPGEGMVSLGMIVIAQPLRRQGLATAAWGYLEPWLAGTAEMRKARLGVEQFNPGALAFFQSLGFAITGQAARHRVGDKFVRLLYMEKQIG